MDTCDKIRDEFEKSLSRAINLKYPFEQDIYEKDINIQDAKEYPIKFKTNDEDNTILIDLYFAILQPGDVLTLQTPEGNINYVFHNNIFFKGGKDFLPQQALNYPTEIYLRDHAEYIIIPDDSGKNPSYKSIISISQESFADK